MIKRKKNQKLICNGFTLIEMVIVLLIMGIMLMFTVSLSGQQIQKVKDKAVKESILTEMQTRYSRNLWSSSFAWKMYNTMNTSIKQWENKIDFKYDVNDGDDIENTFMDHFEIKYITFNPSTKSGETSVDIKYSPYKMSCEIWNSKKNVIIVMRVNNNRDYCFEIKQKNCRLIEMSEESCNKLENDAWINKND